VVYTVMRLQEITHWIQFHPSDPELYSTEPVPEYVKHADASLAYSNMLLCKRISPPPPRVGHTWGISIGMRTAFPHSTSSLKSACELPVVRCHKAHLGELLNPRSIRLFRTVYNAISPAVMVAPSRRRAPLVQWPVG